MRAIIVFTLILAAVGAAPRSQERIIGGIATTIERYPFIAALLMSLENSSYYFFCGGSVINTRSILSAAHCTIDVTQLYRVRLGSTYSSSGGVVYVIDKIFNHEEYIDDIWSSNIDHDISIIQTSTPIAFVDNLIQPATIAGPNYNIPDNAVVWPAGWGRISDGTLPEELRHTQTWAINQETCTSLYAGIGYTVTLNMICTGWLDMGGRGQCNGDSGGPVVHNGVVIGITSWSYQCIVAQYPSVSTRPSRFANWIQERA